MPGWLGPAAVALAAVSPAFAQQPPDSPPIAQSYESRYDELRAMKPLPDRVAPVQNLVLVRDAARFTLASGQLYALSPVAGRTVAVMFKGKGRFGFTPGTGLEQDRLARFEKTRSLDAPITTLLLLFADSTMAELERQVQFGPGKIPGDLDDVFDQAFGYFGDDDDKAFAPDLMSAFLNNESNALFYAHIVREDRDPLMFMLNPWEVEGVRLMGRAPHTGWTRLAEVICQFPRGGVRPEGITGERTRQAGVRTYLIDATLPQTGGGDLGFSASARMELAGPNSLGPWVALWLFNKLKVDSVRSETGQPVVYFKGKEDEYLWVRLDQPFSAKARPPVLTVFYHGDLIDRYVDFFLIKSSAAWYPRSLEGRDLSTFDITFHYPKSYLLAAVGERTDSGVQGNMASSRWVTLNPVRNAGFNLGMFEDYKVNEPGVPPVTVLISEDAHRTLARVYMQQKNMKKAVGQDVTQSLKFFQQVYGESPVPEIWATEIPALHGEAFPGLVHLSWVTFQMTDAQGEDEVFRAHEVAHQWWGISVDFLTYHDQWLSEGFSDFSGLWYMQTLRKDNNKYFGVLRRWRSSIFERGSDPGPIWMGYRTNTVNDRDDYSIVVYRKGAWVLHMLRALMIDLKTMNEDRFTATMKDFYATYRGKRASTEDFRSVVENHVGADMGWFFDQWVYGASLPTYKVATIIAPIEAGKYRVRLQVTQEGVPDSFLAYVPVALELDKGVTVRVRIKVTGHQSEIELPAMPSRPKSVKFNDLEGVLADVKTVDWRYQ